ncbi:MAG: cob(I)yrinic acid a,c-diamide adenosyltransferase [Gemmataceae bacterium]
MVFLSRIYTRSGDAGVTGLGDGARVSKDTARIHAIGDVDELNAALGVLLADAHDWAEAELIRSIQNDLFDVGADLCVPAIPGEVLASKLRVTAHQVERLEQAIDRFSERLQPLTSFILPGGSPIAAACHLARTICRRAERSVVALHNQELLNTEVLKYLNRLSDLLFVLARIGNDDGRGDILWVPGESR